METKKLKRKQKNGQKKINLIKSPQSTNIRFGHLETSPGPPPYNTSDTSQKGPKFFFWLGGD